MEIPKGYDPMSRWTSSLSQQEAKMAARVDGGKTHDLSPEQERQDFLIFEAKVAARKTLDERRGLRVIAGGKSTELPPPAAQQENIG